MQTRISNAFYAHCLSCYFYVFYHIFFLLCNFMFEVNADKTKYLVMSWDQDAGRSHSVKTGNSAFERVEEFKYMGTTLTNQNYIQEEIKSRLKSGNACYHSVQNLLSSSLLFKNLKIKIEGTIILPVLYGCETWLLTLREEHKLRMFENRVLRRIFAIKSVYTNKVHLCFNKSLLCFKPFLFGSWAIHADTCTKTFYTWDLKFTFWSQVFTAITS